MQATQNTQDCKFGIINLHCQIQIHCTANLHVNLFAFSDSWSLFGFGHLSLLLQSGN